MVFYRKSLLSAVLFSQVLNASPTNLVAHEWGTFTSLQGSNGKSMEGVHHEGELVPNFVHGRDEGLVRSSAVRASPCRSKACDWDPVAGTPLAVTQKMETPVIYFYSKTAQNVKVDVDFPGGIITQYYPNVSSFSPPAGQVKEVANGHVSWNVMLSPLLLELPTISPESIWAPSRQVNANYLSSNGENEKFIFYRGLGRFDTPISIMSSSQGEVNIHNPSSEVVPAVFLIQVTPQGGSIRSLGSIDAKSTKTITDATLDIDQLEPIETYLDNATRLLTQSLEQSGLYNDESLAMINTWKSSYFRTPGLRILYVLPRQWTDKLLLLQIHPQPDHLVRTLIGRVEIMTRVEERNLLEALNVELTAGHDGYAIVQKLGRFAEAKLRRLAEIAKEKNLTSTLQGFLAKQLENMR